MILFLLCEVFIRNEYGKIMRNKTMYNNITIKIVTAVFFPAVATPAICTMTNKDSMDDIIAVTCALTKTFLILMLFDDSDNDSATT